MPGVDFVINALFETSGLRCDGDCATVIGTAGASKTKAANKSVVGFTRLILLPCAQCGSWNELQSVAAGRARHSRARRWVKEAACRGLPALPLRYSTCCSSLSNCSFKCRRAAFLIARRSAATPCFSAWRSRRARGSTDCDTCRIFGRRAPMFCSFGFAYGSMNV